MSFTIVYFQCEDAWAEEMQLCRCFVDLQRQRNPLQDEMTEDTLLEILRFVHRDKNVQMRKRKSDGCSFAP